MAGLYAPLPTLRRRPRGRLRTARGRCGSLLLHRSGLAPQTPCRSPGALTRVAARTLAPSPICDQLHRRLQPFRHLHDCSGCFRLERSPGGALTHWKAPPCHGARKERSFAGEMPSQIDSEQTLTSSTREFAQKVRRPICGCVFSVSGSGHCELRHSGQATFLGPCTLIAIREWRLRRRRFCRDAMEKRT